MCCHIENVEEGFGSVKYPCIEVRVIEVLALSERSSISLLEGSIEKGKQIVIRKLHSTHGQETMEAGATVFESLNGFANTCFCRVIEVC